MASTFTTSTSTSTSTVTTSTTAATSIDSASPAIRPRSMSMPATLSPSPQQPPQLPNSAPSAASAFVCLLPEHVRKVEDEDERRKQLLCRLILPFLALFNLICLLSPPTIVSSANNTTFFEFLCWASLVVDCALMADVTTLCRRRDAYGTSLVLALWCNFAVLSACFHYGFVPELFCVLACMPPLLFFVFGGRVGVCALAVVLLEGTLFPLVAPLVVAVVDNSTSTLMASPEHQLQLSSQTSLAAALLVAYVVGLSAWVQDGSRVAYRDKMRAIVLQSEVANRELQQATAAKSNFLANMSHELRTPLHGITAMARELLETLSPRNPARECVEIISDSSEHMLGLVSDILDFERIENNRLDLESIPFSILYEADKAITILSVAAKRKGIIVDKDYRVALPMHVGDPLRFRQILFNLVSNAIKFTPEGGRVTVCVVNDEKEEDLITVEVKDTGIGIAEEHKSHLFSCFSQVDSSIRRRYGGSGLGLAISKRLCEAMHGDIGYQSTFGQGSTFFFSVKLPTFVPPQGDDYCEWAPFNASSSIPVAVAKKTSVHHSASSSASTTPRLPTMNRKKTFSSSTLPTLCFPLSPTPSSSSLATSSRVIPKSPSSSSIASLEGPSSASTSPSPPQSPRGGGGHFSVSSFSASLLTSLSSPFSSPSPSYSNIGGFGGCGCGSSSSPSPSPSLSSFGSISSLSSSTTSLSTIVASTSPKMMLEGARILLVEDNEVNQKVAKRMLYCLGCQVTVAGNGEVCLAVLEEAIEPFDVILMDCQMPILDGFHATLKIREKEKVTGIPRTPVVALTASATKEYQQKCFSVGMDDFLSKPFTKTMLARVLKRWVGTRGATPPPNHHATTHEE